MGLSGIYQHTEKVGGYSRVKDYEGKKVLKELQKQSSNIYKNMKTNKEPC